jgi:hypothetical protein
LPLSQEKGSSMMRSMVSSLVVVGLCLALATAAEDKNDKSKTTKDKHQKEAKITKVDSKKGTVTVKMKDDKGNDVEKTFRLAEDIEYADSTGKVASVDFFTSGDMVLIVEREGKISKMKKKDNKSNKDGKETNKERKDGDK